MGTCHDHLFFVIDLEVNAIDSIHASFQLDDEISLILCILRSHLRLVLRFDLKLLLLAHVTYLYCKVNAIKLALNGDSLKSLAQVWTEVKFEILRGDLTRYLSLDESMDILSADDTIDTRDDPASIIAIQ